MNDKKFSITGHTLLSILKKCLITITFKYKNNNYTQNLKPFGKGEGNLELFRLLIFEQHYGIWYQKLGDLK